MIFSLYSFSFLFSHCFIKAQMLSLECILSIHIHLFKGLLHWWVVHLVQNFQNWWPGNFHILLRWCCGCHEACLGFHKLRFLWSVHSLMIFAISQACLCHLIVLCGHWWKRLLSINKIEIVRLSNFMQPTERVLLDWFSRCFLNRNLSFKICCLNHVHWCQRWRILGSFLYIKVADLILLCFAHLIHCSLALFIKFESLHVVGLSLSYF